jgi:hypothetical protein
VTLLEQLRDGFDTPRADLWAFGYNATAARGLLTISPAFDPTGGPQPYSTAGMARSVAQYDARGSYLVVEARKTGRSVGHRNYWGVYLDDPWTNAVLFQVRDDSQRLPGPDGYVAQTLDAVWRVAGSETVLASVAYDPDLHRWTRLREDGGAVYWEGSPDGFGWTTITAGAGRLDLSAVRAFIGVEYTSVQEPTNPLVVEQVNLVSGDDDPATLTGTPGEPYLAVDVIPDQLAGTFVLGTSKLDGYDMLGWTTDAAGAWLNIVCDVRRVRTQRGATREQGVLVQTEAGAVTVELSDVGRQFEPTQNSDVIHRNTPLRLRAWGYADVLETAETRRNLVPNPRVAAVLDGWGLWVGQGFGYGTVERVAAGGPSAALPAFARVTWQGSPSVDVGAVYVDGTSQGGHPIPVVYGQTVSAALWGRSSVANRLALQVWWRDYTGTILSRATSAAVVVPANTWQRFTLEGLTTPAQAQYASLAIVPVSGAGSVTPPANSTMDATGAQLELAATVGAYFDGDSGTDGATVHSWLGTPRDSASTEGVQLLTTQRWDAVLFTGVIDEVRAQYSKTDPPLVTVTGLDVVGQLAAWGAPGYDGDGVGAGDDLGQRVTRTLAEVGFGELSPESDRLFQATLAPTVMADPWTELTDAVEAELGRLWVDNRNRLVASARGSLPAGPVRGTLSDVHGEAPLGVHCCVADAAVVFGVESMCNRAVGQRRKLPSESSDVSIPTTQRDDVYSQSRYGLAKTERKSLMLRTDTAVRSWAEALIVRQTYPELRVDAVQPLPSPVDLDSAVAAWPAVLRTDIGDRWLFRYTPAVGDPVNRGLGVVGITLEASPDGWSVSWTTEDAPTPDRTNPRGWWTLGLSQLDSGDVLAPFTT